MKGFVGAIGAVVLVNLALILFMTIIGATWGVF